MPAARKRPRIKPANDPRPQSSHRISYVMLPQPYWNARRIVAAAILVLFALGVAVIVIVEISRAGASLTMAAPTADRADIIVRNAPAAASIDSKKPLFDITLNASQLAPPRDQVEALADKLPATVLAPRPVHTLSQAMELSVDGASRAVLPQTPPSNSAAFQNQVAHRLLRQGDARQALRFEHRAAELAPANMGYRYALAILYDRIGDSGAAVMLYGQVLAAHAAHDSTLPRNLNPETVRRRAIYLASMAP